MIQLKGTDWSSLNVFDGLLCLDWTIFQQIYLSRCQLCMSASLEIESVYLGHCRPCDASVAAQSLLACGIVKVFILFLNSETFLLLLLHHDIEV